MDRSLWSYSLAKGDVHRDAYNALRSCCPCRIIETDAPLQDGPGLLWISEMAFDVERCIQRFSSSTASRLMVVSLEKLPSKTVWRVLQLGASECIIYDGPATALSISAKLARWLEIEAELESPLILNNLVGHSRTWRDTLRLVIEAAKYTSSSILLMGETGTGKELMARLIHALDRRQPKGELITVDCTTIVPELAGSEFFGHERGAFTGAIAPRDGAFALAHGGTLLLDEVGELPLPLQAQLLRVIQEQTYKRVGGNNWQRTRFRLICATNRDLRVEVAEGRFRADLYYRLATWSCKIPALRDRNEDILVLADFFARQARPGLEAYVFDDCLVQYLTSRDYPGNVRELKHVVARITDRYVSPGPITAATLSRDDLLEFSAPANDHWVAKLEEAVRVALRQHATLKEITRECTEATIRFAVGQEEGNLQKAAQRLGITDRALQMRRASQRSVNASP